MKYLLTVVVVVCSFSANAGDKEITTTSLLDFYAKKIHALNKENLALVKKGKADQVKTKISIDLSKWKFNFKTREWYLPEPTPSGDIVFTPLNGKYYYSYDAKTKIKNATKNPPQTNSIGDFNDTVIIRGTGDPTNSDLFLYYVEFTNIPLLTDLNQAAFLNTINVIHSLTGAQADTAIAEEGTNLHQLLEDLKADPKKHAELTMAMLDKIGDAFHQKLNALDESFNENPVYHIALVRLSTQGINLNNKIRGYDYYEFYTNYLTANADGTVDHNSTPGKLMNVLRTNLNTIDKLSPEENAKTLLDNLVSVVKCYFLDNCSSIAQQFSSVKAQELWNKFVEIDGSVLGVSATSPHMDEVIKICTYIDQCKSAEIESALFLEGMKLLDPDYNSPELLVHQLNLVGRATYLAVYQLAHLSGFEVIGQADVVAQLNSDHNSVAVTMKFKSDQGTNGITEFELEFNTNQTPEKMKEVLGSLGLDNNSYQYWLFPRESTWENYAIWLDECYNRTPSLGVILIARFASGGVLGIHEMFTGTDVFTGEELSGFERALGMLDVLEVGVISKTFIKSLKYSKGARTINILEKSELMRMLNTAFKSMQDISNGIQVGVRKLADKGFNLVYNLTDKAVVYVEGGLNKIKFFENKLELQPALLSTETGGVSLAKFNNGEEVYVAGVKQDGPHELFEKADGSIGVRKVTGTFTDEQINYYVNLSTKQSHNNKVMLGKYDNGGPSSYINRAGSDHVYFDMGDKWDEAYSLVNESNEEIWKINKRFIDNQKTQGKEFWFSHDPYSPLNEQFFAKEVNYLIDLGVKDFEKIGTLWKANW